VKFSALSTNHDTELQVNNVSISCHKQYTKSAMVTHS